MKLVAVLVALTACDARYGTYFNIDGDANQVPFDHVELYFGTETNRSALATPAGVTSGTVFLRDFDASDRFDVPKRSDGSFATESDYYLPSIAANKGLSYVGVAAYREGQVVGVGELEHFKLEDGVVDRYDIELVPKPLLGFSVWGEEPGCFAWTRDRGGLSTIGVMSPNDTDCDGLDPAVDCNDLCPQGATQCDPNRAICGTTQACGAGCNAGGTCAIEQCLPSELCGSPCDKLESLDARMNCYADLQGTNHLEISLVMSPLARPCRNALVFDVPGGRFCTAPQILWFDKRKDDYKFDIQPSPTNPNGCILSWGSPSNAVFAGDHHVLISFGGMPRWSVVIGVTAGDTGTCTTTGDAFGTSGSSPLYDCH